MERDRGFDHEHEEYFDEWESSPNNSENLIAIRALQKERVRNRRRDTRKHSEPTVKYNEEKRESEELRGNFKTKEDVRDGTSARQTVERELKDWGVVDEEGAVRLGETYGRGETYDADKEAKRIIENHPLLFKMYRREAADYNPNIEEEYDKIVGKKEKLAFIADASLADQVRLLCGKNFTDLNTDSFADQMDYYENVLIDRAKTDSRRRRNTDLKIGIRRGVLRAAMLGTPEYGAYNLALKQITDWGVGIPKFTFPAVRGVESGIDLYYDDDSDDGLDAIGDWRDIIDGYQLISEQTAKRNPDLSGSELEHQSVLDTANAFVETTELGGYNFMSAVKWTQLGGRVKKRLAGAIEQQPDDFNISSVDRFIGKSGLSKRQRGLELARNRLNYKLKRLDELPEYELQGFLDKENGDSIARSEKMCREEISRIEHKYNKLIEGTRSEERRQKYQERREKEISDAEIRLEVDKELYGDRDLTALKADYILEIDDLSRKIDKSKSIADKAIDLYFWTCPSPDHNDVLRYKDGSLYDHDIHSQDSYIDWINKAPFSLIKKTHRRIGDGMNIADAVTLAEKEVYRMLDPTLSLDDIDNFIPEKGSRSLQSVNDALKFMRFADSIKRNEASDSDYINLSEEFNKYYVDMMWDWRDAIRRNPAMAERMYLDSLGQGAFACGKVVNRLVHEKKELSDGELIALSREICSKKWLVDSSGDIDVANYPTMKSDKAKAVWCAKNSFANLEPEWGVTSIGKVILARLENEVDGNLHDATEWLAHFKIPEKTYDIKKIKQDLANGVEIGSLEEYDLTLKNYAMEVGALSLIVAAPGETRRKMRLSNKLQKVNQLFSSPASMFVYQELFKYSKSDSSSEEVLTCLGDDIRANIDDYYNEHLSKDGKFGAIAGNKMEFERTVSRLLSAIEQNVGIRDWGSTSQEAILRSLSKALQNLGDMGQKRSEYTDEATAWLTKYKLAPSVSLVNAWKNRAIALKYGAEDTLKSVNDTMARHEFEESLDNSYSFQCGYLTRDDILTRYHSFVSELTRQRGGYHTYSIDDVVDGITMFDECHNSKKILPPREMKLEHKKGNYVGTVLAHDDPRGMTIGLDTGCCMTIGGASDSCIRSGYRDENAGFFALYEDGGKIVAQSYFYMNPEDPEILVMDNIEANSGRSGDTVVDLYEDFFKKYLSEQFAKDPNWKIREVHIGTRYGELVKPIVKRLPGARIVNNPDQDVYTDASQDQRLLFRLTDQEIAEARGGNIDSYSNESKLTPTHRTEMVTTEISKAQAELIQDLEAQLYPAGMRQYGNEDFLDSELSMPGVEKYSFLMNSQTDAITESIGYCLAYEADSEVEPDSGEKCVYVADFGILPGHRNGLSATVRGLDQLLVRVGESGHKRIEMEARESTSYRLLTSSVGQNILASRGYRLADHGLSEDFGEGERTHLISLERLPEAS